MSNRQKSRRIRRLFFAALGIFASLQVADPSGASHPQPLPDLTARLDELIPELIEQHHTPGVSVALIRDREVVWAKGYGVKETGGGEAVDAETVFESASMSKPLYGLGVMTLIEAGQLDLDRPLVEYLDEPYLPDDSRHEKITARMVLDHTTGLPNWREGGWRSGGPLATKCEPGTKFGYSGEGFLYLQRVVEQITGEPMAAWMDRIVLEPLGMTHSSYKWRDEYAETAASGHDTDGKIKTTGKRASRENAAYTLFTTPTDYSQFLIAMMPDEKTSPKIVKRESLEAMLNPTVKTDKPNIWRGLGWAITKTDDGNYIWHNGSNGTGFECVSRFDPATGEGIVVMTNGTGGRKVWEKVVDAVWE